MTEWSLSRAYSTFQQSKEKSFAVLTSWRYDKSNAENESNFQSLKSQVRGFVELRGVWTDSKTGVTSYEPSLWINGLSLEQARSLASQSQLDEFFYAGPETNGAVTLYSGGGTTTYSNFSPSTFAQGYSSWRKRPFHFEWVNTRNPRWMLGMAYGVFVKRFVENLVGAE